MQIILSRGFKKKYKKLKPSEQRRFGERRDLFLDDPFHPLLNNHVLQGEYSDYRSINIAGDLRVHYEQIDDNTVIFITIGTHHELYGK